MLQEGTTTERTGGYKWKRKEKSTEEAKDSLSVAFWHLLGKKSKSISIEGRLWHVCGFKKSSFSYSVRTEGHMSQQSLEINWRWNNMWKEEKLLEVAGDVRSTHDIPATIWLRCVLWPVNNHTWALCDKWENLNMSIGRMNAKKTHERTWMSLKSFHVLQRNVNRAEKSSGVLGSLVANL